MRRATFWAVAFVLTGLLVLGGIGALRRSARRHLASHLPALRRPVSRTEALRQDRDVVAKFRHDPRPRAQDLVGQAELRLAYADAQKGNFGAGRAKLLEASKVKGTGRTTVDFGGINDQAAYQAIVCLVPQHKDQQARAEFRAFMRNDRFSPLVHAAYKRLVRLNKGKSDPNDEALLQSDIAAQEKRVRFETSVCGPKAAAYLLRTSPRLFSDSKKGEGGGGSGAVPDYRALAVLFGTTDKGTTIEGMRKGLRKLGIMSFGWQVNRRDFDALPTPAILLSSDHYYALLRIQPREALVYDPLCESQRTIPLPALDSPNFSATVLTFQPIAPLEGNN